MSRYIDADELTEFLWNAKETTEDKEKQAMYRAFVGIVNASPTADVQEVKHGHWAETEIEESFGIHGRCSVCGKYATVGKYCLLCGAIMDEETE